MLVKKHNTGLYNVLHCSSLSSSLQLPTYLVVWHGNGGCTCHCLRAAKTCAVVHVIVDVGLVAVWSRWSGQKEVALWQFKSLKFFSSGPSNQSSFQTPNHIITWLCLCYRLLFTVPKALSTLVYLDSTLSAPAEVIIFFLLTYIYLSRVHIRCHGTLQWRAVNRQPTGPKCLRQVCFFKLSIHY